MSAARLVARRVRLEQKMFWRNPQSAFFNVAMPVVLVVVLGLLYEGERLARGERVVSLVLPGILAFGLIATNYANLASTIAIQRDQGVLKRMRGTPLRPGVFLAGQVGSALVVSAVLTVTVVAASALLFDVRPPLDKLPALILAVGVGCACFCALGLALTSFIRSAESAGAVTQASYLPLALISGVFYPFQHRPGWLVTLTGLFPVGRLADALRAPFTHSGIPVIDLLVLAMWSVVGAIVGLRSFRWTKSGT